VLVDALETKSTFYTQLFVSEHLIDNYPHEAISLISSNKQYLTAIS